MPLRGLRRDDPAHRVIDGALDLVRFGAAATVPAVTHNRDTFDVPRRDQGRSNFCVRFATTRAMEYLRVRAGLPYAPLSPLFCAWNDAMPGDRGLNVGTQIYLAAQAATQFGAPSEDGYPWELFAKGDYLARMKRRPPDDAFHEAERHQVLASYRVPDGNPLAIHEALQAGHVVIVGGPVDKGFEQTGGDGILPLFRQADFLGLHAFLVVDADHVGGRWKFVFDNSWGGSWAKDGRGYLDAEDALRLKDCRVLTSLEIPK